MDEQPTCGKGLAEHSVLPAALGDLVAAMAENLEVHQTALDVGDPSARAEYDAYAMLASEQRSIAERLRANAGHMAGFRDLPIGRHREEAMTDGRALNAFAAFVSRESELLALLQGAVERDRRMLAEMRVHAAART